jgi:hypothetical protein
MPADGVCASSYRYFLKLFLSSKGRIQSAIVGSKRFFVNKLELSRKRKGLELP